MMVAEVLPGPTFATGKPRQLFHSGRVRGLWGEYDVSPDGQRFLVNANSESRAEAVTGSSTGWLMCRESDDDRRSLMPSWPPNSSNAPRD